MAVAPVTPQPYWGTDFAAWEEPALSATEVRAACRSLRGAQRFDFFAVDRGGLADDLGRKRDLVVRQGLQVGIPADGHAAIVLSED
jgi:hypothetical protein